MLKGNSFARRAFTALAVLPLTATGVVLTAPSAVAAENEITKKSCDTSKNGKDLDIKVKVFHNDDGDVEWVEVRATDRFETGSFKKKGVNLKEISIQYIDDVDAVTVDESDSDSPYTLDDDGTDVEEVQVQVTWKVKGEFKTKSCNIDDLD